MLLDYLPSLPAWATTLVVMLLGGAAAIATVGRAVFPQASPDRARVWLELLTLVSRLIAGWMAHRRREQRRRERDR